MELNLLLDGVWKRKNGERSMMLGVVEKKSREERDLQVEATGEQETTRRP
jgi:hypothetical protein